MKHVHKASLNHSFMNCSKQGGDTFTFGAIEEILQIKSSLLEICLQLELES